MFIVANLIVGGGDKHIVDDLAKSIHLLQPPKASGEDALVYYHFIFLFYFIYFLLFFIFNQTLLTFDI